MESFCPFPLDTDQEINVMVMVGGKEGTSGNMLSCPAIEVRDNEDINEIEIMRRK